MRCCTRDEGGPLGAGGQAQAPNHRKLLSSRAVVVSVAEKSGRDPGRYGWASVSGPLMKRRNRIWRCRSRGLTHLPGRVRGLPEGCPSGIRRVGGAKLNQALVGNVGTCRSDAKGAVASGDHREDRSTDAEHRDGAVRSRDEGPVMGLDRRGCVVQSRPRANRQREEPCG